MRAAFRLGAAAQRAGVARRALPVPSCSVAQGAARRCVAVPARAAYGPAAVHRVVAAPSLAPGSRAFGSGVVARALRAAAGLPARSLPATRQVTRSVAAKRAPGRRRWASTQQSSKVQPDASGTKESAKAAEAAAKGKPAPKADKASGAAQDAAAAKTPDPSSIAAEAVKIAEHDAAKWGALWPVVRSWRWCSAQLKELWTRYGWLTVITWFGLYNVVLWSIFAARRTGLFKGMDAKDVEKWMNGLSLKKRLLGPDHLTLSPAVMDFLIAWLLVKTTEPIRAVAVVLAVPVLVRRLPTWVLFRLGAKNIPGRTGGPGL